VAEGAEHPRAQPARVVVKRRRHDDVLAHDLAGARLERRAALLRQRVATVRRQPQREALLAPERAMVLGRSWTPRER